METHLQLLCEQLRETMPVHVVVSSTSRATVHEQLNGVDILRLGTTFKLAGASVSPGMRDHIHRFRDSLVHIHLPNPTATLAYMASGHRGPLIATYHSDIVRQRILGSAYGPFLRRFLDRCDSIIVASHGYLKSSEVLRAFKNKCVVIPFGMDLSRWPEARAESVAAIRSRFGQRIVLGVGRFVGYKGFEYLIKGMQTVDAHLLLVGSGPLEGRYNELIAKHGLWHRVTLLSHVPDVAQYYHAADVFVLPSITRAEAFGIVQLEAMASAKPVINTTLDSGVPEVSLHGETGVSVAARDSDALSDALRSMFANERLRHMYGERARLRVEHSFSAEAMVRQTLMAYKAAYAASSSRTA